MVDRGADREALPFASREELELPLLASQLSDLPYMFTAAGPLAEEARKLVPHARLLYYQAQQQGNHGSCWYLLKGQIHGIEALILVFPENSSHRSGKNFVLFSFDNTEERGLANALP